jgi:hypothetical protein
MSQVANLQGNVGMLAGLLLLSWTVAAVATPSDSSHSS